MESSGSVGNLGACGVVELSDSVGFSDGIVGSGAGVADVGGRGSGLVGAAGVTGGGVASAVGMTGYFLALTLTPELVLMIR